jgi:diaminopimelate decarboxylase
LTKVLYLKKTPVKQFVVIDAAMTELIRPALYGSYHEIVPLRKTRAAKVRVDVVGPVCESGDFLAQGRLIPAVGEGEYLAILSTGAYGMVMASNYNSRPRAPEVLVNGRGFDVVRRRETINDLIRGESTDSA